ncbi:MAG TPA: hypothetical protein PK595_06925 [Bacteroidota bacterium]|nr:hypothetical protein [Bacteroidota bacterium]
MKEYTINGKKYTLKERYTAKDWGKILIILGKLEMKDGMILNAIAQLMLQGDYESLLNIVLSGEEPITTLYDDDFSEAARALEDFLDVKKNILSASTSSLAG